MKEARIALLKKYIQDDPNEPFNHYALAMEYMDTDAKAALKILNELSKNHPDYHAAYYHKAALERTFEDYEAAKKTYQLGIEVCQKKGENKLKQELQAAYEELLFELDEL